jgi:hypothetical protein
MSVPVARVVHSANAANIPIAVPVCTDTLTVDNDIICFRLVKSADFSMGPFYFSNDVVIHYIASSKRYKLSDD